MRYTKIYLIVLFVITNSSFCLSQIITGFATGVRIDTSTNYFRKDFLAHKTYLTDYSGGSINQSFLFREVDLSPYELLAGSLTFSDKDQIQKINFQPFKLVKQELPTLITNLKINIVQKK